MTEPAKPAEPTLDVRIDTWLRGLAKRRDGGQGKKRTKTVRVLVYWPEAEWDAMAARWPAFVPEYGDDHDTHRRNVEDMLRRHAEEPNASLGVASLTVDGLVEFAEARELDPAASETRAAYAAELGRAGKVTSWPPSLRQKCWCGSGISYRDCCAAI
ncbi:SEC-C domain-containing protein [Cryptosporangium phraense]|uniref:SEC-C domain-containing protein n=1 Tax=Cryptosporangium phraense TaxID=2593070 RepID=A0A545APM6_9ACTN|nr:SEC-C domain-containing protein [Cryptosporangium phraense]TQS43277.1 SEC-C domain-containing protein [Cryptosporangium phraense]